MDRILDLGDYLQARPGLYLALGCLAFILATLFSAVPTMIASQSWTATEGVITYRVLVGQRFKEYDGDYYTRIEGQIRYEYSADGISYTSTAANSLDVLFYPEEIVRRYPEGKAVTVYYNPRDPAEAVLEPGLVYSGEAFGWASTLLLLAGIYSLAQGVRGLSRSINH